MCCGRRARPEPELPECASRGMSTEFLAREALDCVHVAQRWHGLCTRLSLRWNTPSAGSEPPADPGPRPPPTRCRIGDHNAPDTVESIAATTGRGHTCVETGACRSASRHQRRGVAASRAVVQTVLPAARHSFYGRPELSRAGSAHRPWSRARRLWRRRDGRDARDAVDSRPRGGHCRRRSRDPQWDQDGLPPGNHDRFGRAHRRCPHSGYRLPQYLEGPAFTGCAGARRSRASGKERLGGVLGGCAPRHKYRRDFVVGFGAICSGRYPADVLIAGNPARAIKPIPTALPAEAAS